MNFIIDKFNILKQHLLKALARFPETLLLVAAFGICGIVLNHMSYEEAYRTNRELVEHIMMALTLGIPYSGLVRLLAERGIGNVNKKLIHGLGTATVALVMVLFYFTIPQDMTDLFAWRLAVLTLSGYLAFSLVLFFPKQDHYPLSVLKIIADAAVTTLFSLVTFGGIAAIMYALDALLGLPIESEWYADSFILIATFFAPSHFLGAFIDEPKQIEDYGYSKVFKVLLGTIIAPLLLVYTAILYAYFIKLIFDGALPQGILAELAMWYSIIALAALFFTASLTLEKAFIKWFQKFMPFLMLLPLGMMFLAIFIRINEYGITVKRYFVVALALWVLGNTVYRLISKVRLPQVMVLSAVLVMILSLYGPWSAYPISIAHQNQRFEQLLTELKMLDGAQIVGNQSLSDADKEKVRNMLQYFEYQHSFSDVKLLPKGFDATNDMKSLFGFEYWGGDYNSSVYLSIWSDNIQGKQNLAGYEQMIAVNWSSYDSNNEQNQNGTGALEKSGYTISKTGAMKWLDAKGAEHEMSFNAIIEDVPGLTNNQKSVRLDSKDAWREVDIDGQRVKVYIQNVSAVLNGDGTFTFEQIQVLMFTK